MHLPFPDSHTFVIRSADKFSIMIDKRDLIDSP